MKTAGLLLKDGEAVKGKKIQGARGHSGSGHYAAKKNDQMIIGIGGEKQNAADGSMNSPSRIMKGDQLLKKNDLLRTTRMKSGNSIQRCKIKQYVPRNIHFKLRGTGSKEPRGGKNGEMTRNVT